MADAETRFRIEWRWLVATFVVIVLFVPIRRYTLGLGLPFQLELYRLLLIAILAAWGLSLLSDPRVSIHRTGLDAPLGLYALAVLVSIVVNVDTASELSSFVVKWLLVAAGFFLVYFFVASTIDSLGAVHTVLTGLTVSGIALACLAIVESRTGVSLFVGLEDYVPILTPINEFVLQRGDGVRALGSAEHPIANGAVLVMIAPLSLYLALSRRRWFYWLGLGVLIVGSLATISRTSVLMLGVIGVTFLVFRPRESLRFAPLIAPLLVAVYFSMPGTLGTLYGSFLGERLSNAGRTQDYGPAVDQIKESPFFGSGAGTRIVTGPEANADVLDNQWLGSVLETGFFGVFALAMLFLRFMKRMGAAIVRDDSTESWLLLALTSSVAAYAASMLVYDTLAFIQVTLIFFVLLGLGSALCLSDAPILGHEPHGGAVAVLATADWRGGMRARPGRLTSKLDSPST